MSPIIVLLFAFFGGSVGQAFINIPAIYRASDNAAADLQEILSDIPASTGNLDGLGEDITILGEITGARNFDAVEDFDFNNPITTPPDTLSFPFQQPPGFAPPPLGGAAQNIFNNFVPDVQGPPEDIAINFPIEIDNQGFQNIFANFGRGNSGFKKGSFETDGKETLQVNVLDDILSED